MVVQEILAPLLDPIYILKQEKTSNQKALNPKLFKFKIKDTRSPYVSSVYFYKFDSLNNRTKPYEIKLKKINDSLIMADELSLDGRLAFGLAGFDR